MYAPGSDNTGTNIASIVMGTNSYDINSSNTGTTYYFENSTSKNAWITSLSITYTTGGGTPTVVILLLSYLQPVRIIRHKVYL